MPNEKPDQDALRQLFRETVLVLGGVFAVRGTDDETIRRVSTGLERVYERARRTPGAARGNAMLRPHPAIARLLRLADSPEEGHPRPTPVEQPDQFVRRPGLFRSWELGQVIEAGADVYVEGAGATSDGGSLFAVYQRELPDDDTQQP